MRAAACSMTCALPTRLSLFIAVSIVFASSSFAARPTFAQQTVTGGQSIFETRCQACHSTGSDRVVGPGLAGVTERRDRPWLVSFITDPAGMIESGDSIAVRLFEEYQMPMPNFGLSAAEAEAVIDYLEAPQAAVAAAQLPTGDPARGRSLFTGGRRLENGGPACISCHNVAGIGRLGGGTLAKSLTGVATAYGAGLPTVIQASPFPGMQAVFASRPLTPQEVSDLASFLVAAGDTPTPTLSSMAFP